MTPVEVTKLEKRLCFERINSLENFKYCDIKGIENSKGFPKVIFIKKDYDEYLLSERAYNQLKEEYISQGLKESSIIHLIRDIDILLEQGR